MSSSDQDSTKKSKNSNESDNDIVTGQKTNDPRQSNTSEQENGTANEEQEEEEDQEKQKPYYDSQDETLDKLETKILEPMDEQGRQLVRMWGESIVSKNAKLRFHVITNHFNETIPESRIEYHEADQGGISLFPKSSCRKFLDTFSRFQNESSKEKFDEDEISYRLKMFLATENNMSLLSEIVEGEYEDLLNQFLSDLFREILPEDVNRTWTYTNTIPARGYSAPDDQNNSASSFDSSSEEDTDEDLDVEQLKKTELPQVTVMTHVVQGEPVSNLSEGDPIRVRLKGSLVNTLPESKRDERQPEVSIPFDATVVYTQENPELPHGVNGNAEEMLEIVVDVNDGGYGRGFVHQNEKIDTSKKGMSKNSNFTFQLFLVGSAILLLLLMAFTIFMVI